MLLSVALEHCPLFAAELERLDLNNTPIHETADRICEARGWPEPPHWLRVVDGMLELEECFKHGREPNWEKFKRGRDS